MRLLRSHAQIVSSMREVASVRSKNGRAPNGNM
jgi:hypothetical protein